MKYKNILPAGVILAAMAIAALVAWAGADTVARVRHWPLLMACAVLAFAIQWAAFVPAFLLQTEKFYDLVGSLTYLA
ncbi:MAG: hypothetical protein ACKOWD_16960, partial [Rhodoferax sp.]